MVILVEVVADLLRIILIERKKKFIIYIPSLYDNLYASDCLSQYCQNERN